MKCGSKVSHPESWAILRNFWANHEKHNLDVTCWVDSKPYCIIAHHYYAVNPSILKNI